MKARGQNLVLMSLFLFLLAVMVLVTLNLGHVAARRTDLNNAADAVAYSQAVATARAFNSAAMTNRSIVANYIAMSGIQAQMAHGTVVHAYFNLAALLVRMLDIRPRPGAGNRVTFAQSGTPSETEVTWGNGQRTNEVRAASYTLWHASLSFLTPEQGQNPGDEVNLFCTPGAVECGGGYGWRAENSARLEKAASDQVKDLHRAIIVLAKAQKETLGDLRAALGQAKYEKDVLAAMGLQDDLQGTHGGESKDELERATWIDRAPHAQGFQRTFAEVILGSRPREQLMLPNYGENLAPVTQQLHTRVQNALDASGTKTRVFFSPGDTSSDFAKQGDLLGETTEEPYENPNQASPSMEWLFGRFQNGEVFVEYDDPAGLRRISSAGASTINDTVMNVVFEVPRNVSVFIRSDKSNGEHRAYGNGYGDGMHWGESSVGFGCHGQHSHYMVETPDKVHGLDDEVFPSELLDYVLPSFGDDGAGGVWGQPKLSVMLERKTERGAERRRETPWSREVKLAIQPGNQEDGVDLRKDYESSAMSAALAYYHRREHLGEPPNLLNPYWRATLVPMEIDERPRAVDRSNAPRATLPYSGKAVMNESSELNPDMAATRGLYEKFARSVEGMRVHPSRD